MKTRNKLNIWLWVLACIPCLLTGCDHDVHDGEGEGGLSVSLAWADEADEGTEVKDVKTWIMNAADGTLVEQSRHVSAQETASERYDLPEGRYRILTTTNLVAPFTLSEQTRAVDNMNNLVIGLSDPNVSPEHAYYGVTDRHKQGGCALYHQKCHATCACRTHHQHKGGSPAYGNHGKGIECGHRTASLAAK